MSVCLCVCVWLCGTKVAWGQLLFIYVSIIYSYTVFMAATLFAHFSVIILII